jgi:hypothetical protein
MNESILAVGSFGTSVSELQTRLGQLGYEVSPTEVVRQFFGPSTRAAVLSFQSAQGLSLSGALDAGTVASLGSGRVGNPKQSAVVLTTNGQRQDGVKSGLYTATGRVFCADSPAVGGLEVQLVDKNVGGDVPVGAPATTDSSGAYQISVAISAGQLAQHHKTRPDLQVRVLSGGAVLGTSVVAYNALPVVTLNVLLPKGSPALASEYESLAGVLASSYGGDPGSLQQNKDLQDFTFLANKTGWDARVVAMTALASRFSQTYRPKTTGAGMAIQLKPDFFYALFRAGLPANPDTLFRISSQQVVAIWTRAIEQNIIASSLKYEIAAAGETFQAIAAGHSLGVTLGLGPSTLGDLAGVTLKVPAQQQQFADLYARYKDDPASLWANVSTAFGPPIAQKLQLDGLLAYLTVNNAPLISALYGLHKGLSSAIDLVQLGYHNAANWQPLLASSGVSIPAQIPGANQSEREANYAELMSAQIRLSYPTAVVADLMRHEVTSFSPAANREGVLGFFNQHQGKFELGIQPVERYLALNGVAGVPKEVVSEIKRIQRVYQITPNNQALAFMLKPQLNIDSAYKVTRHDQGSFVRGFAEGLGGEDVAKAVHARARAVYGAALNVVMGFITGQRAPQLGSNVAGSIIEPGQLPAAPTTVLPAEVRGPGAAIAAAQPVVVASATLQTLLGSLDYCTCDDCRSVLSPAAYLVDLLDYIDIAHPSSSFLNPQDVLFERRPDIQHLPLTCENTNIELPYLDLVNEALEYYVTNGSLANYAGHNTDGNLSKDELMASPQFVDGKAYATLKGAWFPPPLPFDRDLQILRLYFTQSKTALPDAMAVLRASDALERPAGATSDYGWRDILMEQLALSREEYQILTDMGGNLTLQAVYGFPNTIGAPEVVKELSNVDTFCHRVGITYEDLVSILKTDFVNPGSRLVPRLEALHTSFSTLAQVANGNLSASAFANQLPPPPALDPAAYGGSTYNDIAAWVIQNFNEIKQLLVIANPKDPNDLCAAPDLRLCYPDPTNTPSPDGNPVNPLQPIDFIRLLRFIRLWRKLGLDVELTADLVSALLPSASSATTIAALDSAFASFLPRAGFAFRLLKSLGLDPATSVQSLLACWAPIGTVGDKSLYKRMFLIPSLLRQDPTFASMLQATTEKLLDHEPALRAAFNLSGPDFTSITSDPGVLMDAPNFSSSLLSLDNVSAVYRRAWLARTLKLTVVELLSLIKFTYPNVFATPDLGTISPAEPALVLFVRLVQELKAASVKPAQALYLMWNADLSGESAPTDDAITRLAATLRTDFEAVDSQFVLVDDPNGDIAQSLLSLAYGKPITDFFFGLINNTYATTVQYSSPQGALPSAFTAVSPKRIIYDDLRKQLTFLGVLDLTTFTALTTAAAAVPALLAASTSMHQLNQNAVSSFFAAYPELQKAYDDYVNWAGAPAASAQEKRRALLADLLDPLRSRRIKQQAFAAVTAAAGADASFAATLLDDITLLASADGTSSAVSDLTALDTEGLSVRFFLLNDPTKTPDVAVAASPVAFPPPAGTLPAGSTGPMAATWKGFISAPQDGPFQFSVATDANQVALFIGGADAQMQKAAGGTIWTNQSEVSLVSGALVPITLTAIGLKTTLSMTWASSGFGWAPIPGRNLYSDTILEAMRVVYVRFLKSTSLASSMNLTASELAHFAKDPDLMITGDSWLKALPTVGLADPATAVHLREVLIALLRFALMKAAVSRTSARLLSVLVDPSVKRSDGSLSLLPIMGWDQVSLDSLLKRFFGSPDPSSLKHVENLYRVYLAYGVVRTSGLSADKLLVATTNNPDPDPTVQDPDVVVEQLQAAVRARYAESDWLSVVKPINDTLRDLQRDALVAYILQQLRSQSPDAPTAGITTPDLLFEYLLMDVQMEPCMPSSRVRFAVSSVQLFIEECIRNLIPEVNPADILVDEWPWRKRYRVWQANREIFLYPENYLYPQLRDDQSPIFKETMKQLLQSDVTDDDATSGFINYLTKLEQVAKLEPCALYYEPATDQTDEVAHVVAHTSGAHLKYFHRTLKSASWSPWEDVPLDMGTGPIALYSWNGRLLLFWLRILKQGKTDGSNLPKVGDGSATLGSLTVGNVFPNTNPSSSSDISVMLCYSEYTNGKWQGTKTSHPDASLYLGTEQYVDLPHLFMRVGAPSGPAATLAQQRSLDGTSSTVIKEGNPPVVTMSWDAAGGDTSIKTLSGLVGFELPVIYGTATPDPSAPPKQKISSLILYIDPVWDGTRNTVPTGPNISLLGDLDQDGNWQTTGTEPKLSVTTPGPHRLVLQGIAGLPGANPDAYTELHFIATITTTSPPPKLAITFPADGADIGTPNLPTTVSVSGSASSASSKISAVQLTLDNVATSQTGAQPGPGGDWSSWSGSVIIGTAGPHSIAATCTDANGSNVTQIVNLNISIVPTAADTLVVEVLTDPQTPFGESPTGFQLYNTHSAPVPYVSRSVAGVPADYRALIATRQGGTTKQGQVPQIFYFGSKTDFVAWYELLDSPSGNWGSSANNLLTTDLALQLVPPQADVQNIWDAPFLFGDIRNVVYVTTTGQAITIATFGGFGLLVPEFQTVASTGGQIPPIGPVDPMVNAQPQDNIRYAIDGVRGPGAELSGPSLSSSVQGSLGRG